MTPNETAAAEIVCLVDDDKSVLTSIGRLLASDGLAVRAFNEPESFLAHVKTHSVPVVILDIWMEQMTGLEVQAELVEAVAADTRDHYDGAQRSRRRADSDAVRRDRILHQTFR